MNNNPKNRTSYFLPAGRAGFKFQILYLCIFISLSLYLCFLLYPQTISYGTYNETLVQQANANFVKQQSDADLLVATLKELIKDKPGRVFAGRGGSWGKDFRVSETSYFMYLSSYGIPTVLWLPETWSNNSDTEQYFSEDVPDHYNLYNIRYVVAPPSQKPEAFWTLIKESNSWKLYEVKKATDYITAGASPTVVYSDKLSFGNLMRLWIQSPYPERKIFPEFRISNSKFQMLNPAKHCNNLPCFVMLDEATYKTPDNKLHSLFAQPPVYMTPWEWPSAFAQLTKSDQFTNVTNKSNETFQQWNTMISIINQSSDTDMVFKATVEVKDKCPTCSVILRQTYHPSWKVTVNGKNVKSIDVFPSFTAIRLEEPGTYDIVFSYTPSRLKIILLLGGLCISLSIFFFGKKMLLLLHSPIDSP